jgi:hypothetical protein
MFPINGALVWFLAAKPYAVGGRWLFQERAHLLQGLGGGQSRFLISGEANKSASNGLDTNAPCYLTIALPIGVLLGNPWILRGRLHLPSGGNRP